MARAIYQYQPINDTPDVSIGILLPMNKSADKYEQDLIAISGSALGTHAQRYNTKPGSGGSVFALSYSTEEQAISNLINLLLTFKGERIMQPEFGTKIRNSLFQPNTESLVEFLQESITADINRWLPYIVVNMIDVNRRINSMSLDIMIRFRVGKTGANRIINLLAQEDQISVTRDEIDLDADRFVQVGTFSPGLGATGY